MNERKPFTLQDMQVLHLADEAEVYLDPHHYAEARALIPADRRRRDPARSGEHFLTAYCAVMPTETFH